MDTEFNCDLNVSKNVLKNSNGDSKVSKDVLGDQESDLEVSKLLPVSMLLSPTEERNDKSRNLCSMTIGDAIDLMISEESSAIIMILEKKDVLEQLIDTIVNKLKNGGRLIYVGAGTSGRLGLIDASEISSTFGSSADSDQDKIFAILAGGLQSMTSKTRDCAEDTFNGGKSEMSQMAPNSNDIIIGITASGTTPFTWGAMYQAKCHGSFIALITFNPFLQFKNKLEPDLKLELNVGPEILTGSTRLKCGTVTKCLLNIISTLTMVKLGKVRSNLMINVAPGNSKLKQRSTRIIMSLFANISELEANEMLSKNDFDVRKTIEQIQNRN